MIGDDSSFRRLPTDLSDRLVAYLDALRVSAEMAGDAFADLVATLRWLSTEPPTDGGPAKVAALRHAWAAVDAIHRFRTFLIQAPSIEQNRVFDRFLRETEVIEEVRRSGNRLFAEYKDLAEAGQGPFGTVVWTVGSEHRASPPLGLAVTLGATKSEARSEGPLVDVGEHLEPGEIGTVLLELGRNRVSLTEMIDELSWFVRSIERPLGTFAEGKPRHGSDRLFGFQMRLIDPNGPSPPHRGQTGGPDRPSGA
jgi:hypothetical protein